MQTMRLTTAIGALLLSMIGCASYHVPGAAADMSVFGMDAKTRRSQTDYDLQRQLDRKPLAQFPTAIAVARVQSPGYKAYGCNSYGTGRYSIVTARDVESEAQFDRIARLPLVDGVAPVNRLLLPADLQSDRELRSAAAALHADILLVYTLDTSFSIGDMNSPIDVITLGFLPSKRAYVTTTASAVLLDTRNGYVYGVAEGAAQHDQMANTWTSDKAVDDSRRKTETQAMDNLIDELHRTWSGVQRTYATASAPPNGAAGLRYRTDAGRESE